MFQLISGDSGDSNPSESEIVKQACEYYDVHKDFTRDQINDLMDKFTDLSFNELPSLCSDSGVCFFFFRFFLDSIERGAFFRSAKKCSGICLYLKNIYTSSSGTQPNKNARLGFPSSVCAIDSQILLYRSPEVS